MNTDQLIYGIQSCNDDAGLIRDTMDQWLNERGYEIVQRETTDDSSTQSELADAMQFLQSDARASQPREHAVLCTRCFRNMTFNVTAICGRCSHWDLTYWGSLLWP